MTDDATIRHAELLNRLVIDVDTTEEVGHVDSLLVDLKRAQVEGMICKTGLLGRQKQTFAWSQVASIGQDSLVVHAASGQKAEGASGSQDRIAAAQSVLGLEVWTDTGNQLGRIADYVMDPKSGEVLQYLFAAEGLRELTEGLFSLAPSAILSAGRKRMMVSASAAEGAEVYEVGLNQKATEAADFLKSDYAQTQQDLDAFVKGAKTLADKLKQRTQKLSDYTQENLPELTEQLQERTQGIRDRMQKQVSDVREKLKKAPLKPPAIFTTDSPDTDTIDIDAFEVWDDDDPAFPEESAPSNAAE
ncbi:MAG: hypothetical protein AAFV72_20080 [Cyanobacteria bacterium J06635_1]